MSGDDLDEPRARLAVSGAIATITLDRPAAYNAIDRRMAERLRNLARDVESLPEVKVLIIRGEGRAFCGGGDIRHFVDHLEDIGACIRDLLTPYHEFLVRLRNMPKLVLASVQGSAAGAGLSLVSMCDLCIAADDATFTPAYAKIGVSPDGGGTFGLARAVGPRRALQIHLAEDHFDARQAADWGLVSKLVPDADLEAETEAYAARIARTTGEAIASTKRLLRSGMSATLEDHLSDEMESLIRCMATDTFVSAVNRFAARG